MPPMMASSIRSKLATDFSLFSIPVSPVKSKTGLKLVAMGDADEDDGDEDDGDEDDGDEDDGDEDDGDEDDDSDSEVVDVDAAGWFAP